MLPKHNNNNNMPIHTFSLNDSLRINLKSLFADHEEDSGTGQRGCGRRRRARVRAVLGRGPVERSRGRAEGVPAEAAVRPDAGRARAAGDQDRPDAGPGVRVSHVQDGRAQGHAVHDGPLDQLRDRAVVAHRQTVRPLGDERRRFALPTVPIAGAQRCTF